MSNLKKVLSVGLASTMVMGMVATSAAAATYDKFSDKDEIVNKDAVSMVTELGIIAGLPGGTYAPKQNIDRASFARLVCVALNGGQEPNLGNLKTTFTDTQGNWAEKYIAYCVQQGIIAGKGNNTFAPAANVTGSEAAKMLLVALGYNTTYEKIGGATWQTTTDVLANQAGLYKGLGSMNTSEPLTRDNAAQMIYNTLNATKVKYEMVPGISADGQVTMTTQRVDVTRNDNNGKTVKVTMLEDAFNAIKVEGIVVANEFANLESTNEKGSALDEGKTKIIVTNGDDQSTFKSGTYSVASGADQLGKEVTIYVKDDSSNTSKATVLGSTVLNDTNKVVTSAARKTLKKLADDNDLTIPGNAQVVSNYANAVDYKKFEDTDSTKTRGESKTLIDHDDDGDVDYILVNNMYFGQVSKYSTKEDGSITVKTAVNLTADDKDDVVGFDDVKKDDYVLAAWMGGKLHVQKAEAVTGTLDSYKLDESLTVSGTKYDMSEVSGFTGGSDDIYAPTNDEKIKQALDNEATFYLDANGMIVAVGDVSEKAYDFAYLWDYDPGNTFDDARAKVTLSDGTTKTYTVDKVIDTDGKEVSKVASQTIYAYSINKDGELKLTEAADTTNTGFSFTKGETKVNDGLYATNNTVFFYVSTKNIGTKENPNIVVDDVDVYTGYKNAPTLKNSVGGNVVKGNGSTTRANAVAFEGADITTKDVSDHLYITDIGQVSGKYTTVTAYFAGSDKAQDIKVDSADLVKEGLYLFTKGSDDIYDLSQDFDGKKIDVNGKATNVSDSTLVLSSGKEFDLTEKTVLVDLTDGDDIATLNTLPSEDDTIVSVLVDDADNGDLLMIVINNGKKDSGTISDTESEGKKGNTSDVTDVADAFASGNPNVKASLKAGMADVTVKTADGTVSIGGSIGYTEDLTGFNSSKPEEQKGYYAVLQIKVPSALKGVEKYQTFKADWDGGKWSSPAELDGADYFILVLRLEEGKKPNDVKVQWTDAAGDAIGTSTVKFDVSELQFK